MTEISLIDHDSIVAIATAPGAGGIGILRLSGPRAPQVLTQVFRGGRNVEEFESHKLYHGSFILPGSGEVLDQGLAVWMKAPHSYTGQDVIEMHLHGGPLLLNRFLSALVQQGLRPASPGEFTRRAYLSGKLDLLQAEAVSEIIRANSEAALRNAQSQLEGRLSSQIASLREQLLKLLARLEAAIDFPEEDIALMSATETLSEMRRILELLQGWREKFQVGRLLREGVRVALVGRPNVGKSSLLNRLLDEEKAIVHHAPGTTRDVVEGFCQIEGYGFQFFDTAGIREGEEEVEREGIRRTFRVASHADLLLWLLDGSAPLSEEDRWIGKQLQGSVIPVMNKLDRGVVWDSFPEGWEDMAAKYSMGTRISAKTGEGIPLLRHEMLKAAGLDQRQNAFSQAYLNNARHLAALEEAIANLLQAETALQQALPVECAAADLHRTAHALETLLGKISPEDVLDRLFSTFCVGK